MEAAGALTDMYDPALLGILQHVGNVEEFLRVLFGFLYRKTDFYRLLLRPGDRLGFPPGAAQAMALQVPAAGALDKGCRDRRRGMALTCQRGDEMSSWAEAVPCEGAEALAQGAQRSCGCPIPGSAQGQVGHRGLEHPALWKGSLPVAGVGAGAALRSLPTQTPLRQEQFQTNPDSYNGAVRENYSWSQDYSDLEIKVPVPKHIVKGRQVSVDISSSTIRVAVLEGSSPHVLMEGKLTHKINTESSLWSLEPGKCVLINLNKGDEYWWNAILEGEEQIDIDKINKERSMATVDEEEHAVLDRLTFDYHQKLQGKPQSHELKVHEMLKKGWDTEGSPFRGQKFDPSMFNISPGAVQF
uniref:NudC domain-containing protein 3 n=1 Tax=Amazona collaria TaxID=241587 RepID=A0A8B9F2S9_9PSIT